MCNHEQAKALEDDFRKENDVNKGYLYLTPREYFLRTQNLLMQAGKRKVPDLPSTLWRCNNEKSDEGVRVPGKEQVTTKSFFAQTNMSKLRKQHADNQISLLNEEKSVNFAMDITTKSPIHSPN
jgi:hypothetical protein